MCDASNFLKMLFAHHSIQSKEGRIEIQEVMNSWINPKGPKEKLRFFKY